MHILFFSHYFPPEGNAPASRTYEHCVRWVRAGHSVTVITCVPNVPNGVIYKGYRSRFWPQTEIIDGIRVIRVWTLLSANAGYAKRILNYLSYMFTAVLSGLFVKRPDVIIATSPQFFCGWAGVIVQAVRRLPFVLEIRDIWPESIEAVGAIRQGFIIRVLRRMELMMYASADRIVAVGNGYRDNVAEKLGSDNSISVIYNGVDGEQFQPRTADQTFLESIGFQDCFVCAYVGTIGMAHGLETVLDAAELLRQRGRDDIRFLLVGDGARRKELEHAARERGLEKLVHFTGLLSKAEIPNVIASSACLLVHLRACDLFETVIPSKIFEAMAMERPIVMGVRGESAEIVANSGAGVTMIPGDADSLVGCVTQLCDDRSFYQSLQRKGRQFVLSGFSRDRFAADYLDLLNRLVSGRDTRIAGELASETKVASDTSDRPEIKIDGAKLEIAAPKAKRNSVSSS